MSAPNIYRELREGKAYIVLTGEWTLANLHSPLPIIEAKLRGLLSDKMIWDLSALLKIDSAGALFLWRLWEYRWPDEIIVLPLHREMLESSRIGLSHLQEKHVEPRSISFLSTIGRAFLEIFKNIRGILTLFGQLALDVLYLCANPRDIPFREISANIFRHGAQALPVIALSGLLIGIALSFLSALQLKAFGADIYIVNLLGISVTRELGPIIAAVLVAGRSGSAMTAQIGVMRVTEEIDALETMGISRTIRLILPKVFALSLVMPLLVLWCSALGIVGGMISARFELGLPYSFFIETLPLVVPIENLWIGLIKGVSFGMLIGLVSCHFGLRVRPNTESLSARTTTSVVTAITLVILVDALFAILTRGIGMPRGLN